MRLQRATAGPWLFARLLADGLDISTVRPQTPIFDRILSSYPNLPADAGPARPTNPRLALHTAAAMVLGSSIWDVPARLMTGLPIGPEVDVNPPLTAVALRLLNLPRS